jgi:hypothetical protein
MTPRAASDFGRDSRRADVIQRPSERARIATFDPEWRAFPAPAEREPPVNWPQIEPRVELRSKPRERAPVASDREEQALLALARPLFH